MDFLLPTLSIEAVEVSNAAELSFESNNSDLQFGIVLESDEELNASSTILPGLKTVLDGDENVTSSKYREKEVSLTKFSSDVVLESEEEHDDDTMLTGLQTVLTGLSFTFCEDLAVRNCKQQSKSISLETTIPPITEQCLKQQMIFCAQTTNESCSNATITLYVGSGGSFCKLKTNVNDADSYGNYWCPFPNCCKKSRKRFLLKDHMKKTHHGPFYCKQCGVNFLHLPSLHRHFREWGHSRENYLVAIPEETVRRHTIAAVEFFSNIIDGLPSLEQDAEKNVQFQFADGEKKSYLKADKTSEKLPPLKKKKLNYEEIQKDVTAVSCCSRRCIQSILLVTEIYKTRKWFLKKSRESQAQYLLNFFQIARRSKGQKMVYTHTVENKDVCLKAWIFSYGISYGRYHHWRNEYERCGFTNSIHARQGMSFKSKRRMEAELWFEEFVATLANRMPDVKRRELPSCMTIMQVHEMYAEGTTNPLSPTHFRRMWLEDFRDVIIPKTNRFSKCGVCLLITEHIRCTQDKKDRVSWTQRKQLHMDQQAGERKKYYKHQKKAVTYPEKYLSIIIDGMDQSKTHLPHWVQCSKLEGDNAHFLKTHLTGVLSHGNGLAICFLDLMRWPQDSNPTTNALTSTFRQIISERRNLPPVLYLQLDNCYRDCKNIHILGFCALLVKTRVFKKVRLSYLMVGHTHEDIDQMFSRIAETLRRTNAVTVDQLRNVIHNSYSPSPSTVYRENIFDIKSWLRPYIATLKHHSNPHAFRFKLNEQGQVEMTYRNWAMASKKEWLPKEGPFHIMEVMPEGYPPLLRPDNLRCPTAENMEGALRHVAVRMSPEELNWWNEFVKYERKKRALWEHMTNEDYETAGSHFDLMSMRSVTPLKNEKPEQDEAYKKREKALKELIAKKNSFPPVQLTKKAIGGKRRKRPKESSENKPVLKKIKKHQRIRKPLKEIN